MVDEVVCIEDRHKSIRRPPHGRSSGAGGSVRRALTREFPGEGRVAMGEGTGAPAGRAGRNYVVVSADTHASPDSLDHFLSYVDPAHREAVAAFGDMSSLAISMFGGFDPGEVDEPDPVRATAARRLAGMGVDTDAARGLAGPLRHGLGGARRRRRPAAGRARGAGDPRRGDLPGPMLAGGLRRHVPRRANRQGPRGGLAGAARLRPLAGRLLRRRPGAARRLHAHRLPRHGPGGRGGRVGPGARHLRGCDAARHVDDLQAARLRRRLLRARSGARARTTSMVVNLHTGASGGPPTPSSSTTPSTAACSASTRSSCSPAARCGS